MRNGTCAGLAAAAAAVALGLAAAPVRAEGWTSVRDGKLRGIGGMSLLDAGKGGSLSFVIAHDNKNRGEERIAIVTVDETGADYRPLAWPEDVEWPVDIEALSEVPGSTQTEYWAMTSSGRVTHFRLVDGDAALEVVRTFTLPGILTDENYEGLTRGRLGGVDLVVWGSRGGGRAPGVLYWGVLDGDLIRQEGWMGLTVPWPEGGNVRHLSDLALDHDGNLYLSAASDPGDDGPFDSAVYRCGHFTLNDGRVAFAPALEEMARAPGYKIEAVDLLTETPPRFALGTDDENRGSSLFVSD